MILLNSQHHDGRNVFFSKITESKITEYNIRLINDFWYWSTSCTVEPTTNTALKNIIIVIIVIYYNIIVIKAQHLKLIAYINLNTHNNNN